MISTPKDMHSTLDSQPSASGGDSKRDDKGQPVSMTVDPLDNQHQPRLFYKDAYVFMSVACASSIHS